MDCVWKCCLNYKSSPRRNIRHSNQTNTIGGEAERMIRLRELSPGAIFIEIPPQNNESPVIHENEGHRPAVTGESSGTRTICSCCNAFSLRRSCCWKIWWSEWYIPRGLCEPSPPRTYSDSQLTPSTASSERTVQEQLLQQLTPTPAEQNISSISVNSSTSNRQTGAGSNSESGECIQFLLRVGVYQVIGNRDGHSSPSHSNSDSSTAAVANLGIEDQ